MHEELKWFASFPEELKKFRGKHIAISGTEVVASGDNAIAILKDAKKRFPAKNPVLAFVPKEDALIFVKIWEIFSCVEISGAGFGDCGMESLWLE